MIPVVVVNPVKDYVYIVATILLTVYGQLIIKWRISLYGKLPLETIEKIKFAINVLTDPWIISGFGAAFFASLSWMGAMTKFELTFAYPFTSLSFVLVLFLGCVFFNEQITFFKVFGVSLIIIGTAIATRTS